MSSDTKLTLDTLVSLCKRRGFVYQSSDIYGGLNGVYDFGHLGTLMKKNIRDLWLRSLNNAKGEILQLEGSLLGPKSVWEASGHLAGFHDPMVDCKECKKRFRADELNLEKGCPSCGKKSWTEIREFNMMFKTQLGAMEDGSSDAYLRPETAQDVFINFKNIMSTNRVKIPFGVAQIGKSFRNEITPKQFLFRMREFEQMELEWFCKREEAPVDLSFWIEKRLEFYKMIGINSEKIRMHEHGEKELAHYSMSCVDVEYEFPFGWKELEGIAHRGNYDLTQHTKHSGKDLNVFNEETRESYTPDVVEASVGVDRLFLTLLFDAYQEEKLEKETRVVLKLHPAIAPIKLAFMPLTKKLEAPVKALYNSYLEKGISVQYDVSGSIGKRYRRQDEIGTPFCITYDFESETDHCVTIRNRDTTEQERVSIEKLSGYLGV